MIEKTGIITTMNTEGGEKRTEKHLKIMTKLVAFSFQK